MFVFDGGVLAAEHRSQITLRDHELNEYRFVRDEEAEVMLRPYVWRRVQESVAAQIGGTARYLRDGLSQ